MALKLFCATFANAYVTPGYKVAINMADPGSIKISDRLAFLKATSLFIATSLKWKYWCSGVTGGGGGRGAECPQRLSTGIFFLWQIGKNEAKEKKVKNGKYRGKLGKKEQIRRKNWKKGKRQGEKDWNLRVKST